MKQKIRSTMLKVYFALKSRKIKIGRSKVKYFFVSSMKSNDLCVIFSGYSTDGATYNYVRTLKDININKLYILDNEGYNGMGSYYLGNGCKWMEEDVIEKLVKKISDKRKINRIICLGSSKGGSCALLYGLHMNADYVIMGSPQYHIIWYMKHSEIHQLATIPMLLCKSIYSEKDIDAMINNAILMKNRKTKVYALASSNEGLFAQEIRPLLDELNNQGLLLEFCDMRYSNHSDVAFYFKPFCREKISEILNQR